MADEAEAIARRIGENLDAAAAAIEARLNEHQENHAQTVTLLEQEKNNTRETLGRIEQEKAALVRQNEEALRKSSQLQAELDRATQALKASDSKVDVFLKRLGLNRGSIAAIVALGLVVTLLLLYSQGFSQGPVALT